MMLECLIAVLIVWNVLLTVGLFLVSHVVKNNAQCVVIVLQSFKQFIKDTEKFYQRLSKSLVKLETWKMRIESHHKTEVEEGN